VVIGGGVSGNARIYFGAMLRANLVISNSSVANVSSIRSRRASIPGTPSAGRSARWALVFFDCSRNSRRSWQWSQAGDPGTSSQQTQGPVNRWDLVMVGALSVGCFRKPGRPRRWGPPIGEGAGRGYRWRWTGPAGAGVTGKQTVPPATMPTDTTGSNRRSGGFGYLTTPCATMVTLPAPEVIAVNAVAAGN